jgi:hypothetical protein
MELFTMIKYLDDLPPDLLERAYHLEIINKQALLQHNTFLEDKYKKFKVENEDSVPDVFQDYKINGWDVRIEVEE